MVRGDERFNHSPTNGLSRALGRCPRFHNFRYQRWRCIGIQNCSSNASYLSDDLVFQAGVAVAEVETEETDRKAGNYGDEMKAEMVMIVT